MSNRLLRAILLFLAVATTAHAQQPWTFSDNTRYLSMGDSLAAGFGANPVTQGYSYLLYEGGVFGSITNVIFANAAVPGSTSSDVLKYQVPQAAQIFQPHVITMSVGGNDLIAILRGADPTQTLLNFQSNLVQILVALKQALPDTRIYLHNLYDIPTITANVPNGRVLIMTFNQIMAGVAQSMGVQVADVFTAFDGRNGLLLIARHGAGQTEVHPTNAGYRVIEQTLKAVIKAP